MGKQVSRRDFIKTGTAVGLATTAPRTLFAEAPTVLRPTGDLPVFSSASTFLRHCW